MDNQDWATNKLNDWANKKDTESYEAKMGWYARKVDSEAIRMYLEGESGHVLDIPCGTGRFLKLLESESGRFHAIGADYSWPMLTVANRTTYSPLVRCDGFSIPLKSHSFDIVICSRLVFHYKDPQELIQECCRVLVTDGVFIFDTLNYLSLRHLLAQPMNMIRSKEGKQLWFASIEQVETMLTSCGFTVETKSSRYILPTRAYRFLPRLLVRLLAMIEPTFPENRRVLTYWKARKTDNSNSRYKHT